MFMSDFITINTFSFSFHACNKNKQKNYSSQESLTESPKNHHSDCCSARKAQNIS